MRKNEKFTDIYNKFSNLVFRYALVRVKDEDLAMEFVQQVFLGFFEHMDEVPNDIVKPWLLLCCKREIIDFFRKRDNKNQFFGESEICSDVTVYAEDNTERVIQHMAEEELTFHIMESLKEKNESWFRIMEAVGILEMSQEEAAEYLGISLQVLRAKLYRARKFIRKKYGGKYREI